MGLTPSASQPATAPCARCDSTCLRHRVAATHEQAATHVPRETLNTAPVQPRRPRSGAHSLSALGHTTPGRQEPPLRTKDSSEWHPPTFHVKRRSISSFRRQARSAEPIRAQNHASSVGSTLAPSKLTGVTSTTSAVPAHFDTSLRRMAAVHRASPPRRGQRSE
jgi:hypothetical protein